MTRFHNPSRFAGRTPATLAIAALATLPGCGTAVPSTPVPQAQAGGQGRPLPVTLFQGVNLSGSSLPILSDSIGFAVDCSLAMPDGSRVIVDRFDRADENVYDGDVPGHGEEFFALIEPRLRPVRGRDLTFTGLFVTRAESCVAASRGPIAVSMIGDGFSEGVDGAGHDAIRAAAARMAGYGNLRAYFVVGASPAARSAIRQDFAPLGRRLRFKELSDDPAGIAESVTAGGAR